MNRDFLNFFDIDLDWDEHGMFFSCDHPLYFDEFVKYCKYFVRFRDTMKKKFTMLEDNNNG